VSLHARGWLLLASALLVGCSFGEAVRWAGTKDETGASPAGRLVGSVPGVIQGNPTAWATLGEVVAGFAVGAVTGHFHGQRRERKKVRKAAT